MIEDLAGLGPQFSGIGMPKVASVIAAGCGPPRWPVSKASIVDSTQAAAVNPTEGKKANFIPTSVPFEGRLMRPA